MVITVYDVLKRNIEAEKASAVDFLVSGAAKDFAGYKEIVGLIRGHEASLRIIDDLSRNQREDDDND